MRCHALPCVPCLQSVSSLLPSWHAQQQQQQQHPAGMGSIGAGVNAGVGGGARDGDAREQVERMEGMGAGEARGVQGEEGVGAGDVAMQHGDAGWGAAEGGHMAQWSWFSPEANAGQHGMPSHLNHCPPLLLIDSSQIISHTVFPPSSLVPALHGHNSIGAFYWLDRAVPPAHAPRYACRCVASTYLLTPCPCAPAPLSPAAGTSLTPQTQPASHVAACSLKQSHQAPIAHMLSQAGSLSPPRRPLALIPSFPSSFLPSDHGGKLLTWVTAAEVAARELQQLSQSHGVAVVAARTAIFGARSLPPAATATAARDPSNVPGEAAAAPVVPVHVPPREYMPAAWQVRGGWGGWEELCTVCATCATTALLRMLDVPIASSTCAPARACPPGEQSACVRPQGARCCRRAPHTPCLHALPYHSGKAHT
ncbi:unnamed protein product [Closterium sp. Naga37s-1]|nr:unnamed protein product [Closterium sp. Naga37s-1]